MTDKAKSNYVNLVHEMLGCEETQIKVDDDTYSVCAKHVHLDVDSTWPCPIAEEAVPRATTVMNRVAYLAQYGVK